MVEKKHGKSLSRRDFVKATAASVAVMAGASFLSGCATEPTATALATEAAPTEAPTTAPVATTAPTTAPTAEATAVATAAAPAADPNDWLGTAPGITDDQCTTTNTADVIVVGAGIAGIAAARAACEAGASVMVVEQAEAITVRGLEFGAVNSKFQEGLGCHYEPMELVLELQQSSGNRANPSILKKWAVESGAAFDWFEEAIKEDGGDYGYYLTNWPNPANFDNATEYYKQYCTHIQFTDWVGANTVQYNKSVALGAQYFFTTAAKELAVKDGAVTGVYAQDASGNYVKFAANKGVILATGDYSHNEAMLKVLCPEFYLANGGKTTKIETSNGDGHKMAIWAGGMMEPGPHAHMTHSFAGGFSGLGNTAALQINAQGKRFMNEDIPGQPFTNQIIRQPGAFGWQMWDSNWKEMVMHQSIGHGNLESLSEESLQAMSDRFAAALDPSYDRTAFMAIMAANTLEELIDLQGLPKETALASIQRYNDLCAAGKDEDFGKRSDRMFPLTTGPFFATKSFVAVGLMTAGVVVDADLKVLDSTFAPIPGLWAVGNVAGGRFAIDYPTICPAISHGSAITFGRAAGTMAAGA